VRRSPKEGESEAEVKPFGPAGDRLFLDLSLESGPI